MNTDTSQNKEFTAREEKHSEKEGEQKEKESHWEKFIKNTTILLTSVE